jgi:hypothetical protein
LRLQNQRDRIRQFLDDVYLVPSFDVVRAAITTAATILSLGIARRPPLVQAQLVHAVCVTRLLYRKRLEVAALKQRVSILQIVEMLNVTSTLDTEGDRFLGCHPISCGK